MEKEKNKTKRVRTNKGYVNLLARLRIHSE